MCCTPIQSLHGAIIVRLITRVVTAVTAGQMDSGGRAHHAADPPTQTAHTALGCQPRSCIIKRH